MERARIIRLCDKRFGFVRLTEGEEAGAEVFFHQSCLSGISWDELQENQDVEVVSELGPKGLRCSSVSPARRAA